MLYTKLHLPTFLTLSILFIATPSTVLANSPWQWQGKHQIIPFKISKQLILLEGKIDEQKGYFILDTGAADVVLNQKRFKTNPTIPENNSNNSHFTDAKGQIIENTPIFIQHFQLAGFEAKRFSTDAFDMAHLEDWLKQPLLGIVGHDLFKNLELVIDYPKQVLHVYRLNWLGKRKQKSSNDFVGKQNKTDQNWEADKEQISLQTKFVYQNHLPVLEAKVGEEAIFLGIDTGASDVVMNRQLAQELSNITWQDAATTVYSTQKASGVSQKGQVHQFQLANRVYEDLPVTLLDLSSLQADYQVDGLLGYDFWKNQVTSLNFKTRQLTVFEPNIIATETDDIMATLPANEVATLPTR